MLLNTRDFGEVVFEDNDIITFVQPLYGFEEFKTFALMSEDNTSGYLSWLQSSTEPSLCFILVNPESFKIDYSFDLEDYYVGKLGNGEYTVWLVGVIRENFEESTVNLRSPIVINQDNKKAVQVMLDSEYPVRFPIYSN
ncbi:MAG: flagellar assembly protein FliW [Oscillospiraceae bacterium]|jgi:flagellar assembly factor FliW|nr:flagellar assembly protein FliW [Oscillospiraceae bacterium]